MERAPGSGRTRFLAIRRRRIARHTVEMLISLPVSSQCQRRGVIHKRGPSGSSHKLHEPRIQVGGHLPGLILPIARTMTLDTSSLPEEAQQLVLERATDVDVLCDCLCVMIQHEPLVHDEPSNLRSVHRSLLGGGGAFCCKRRDPL